MSFATDMAKAEMYRETEATNTSLTDAEKSVRYQRRRYFAQTNNSTEVSDNGSFAALQALGAQPGRIDETTYLADRAAFEAALAVCVADGASPTQAHVTTANSTYTTLKADLTYRHFVAADKTAFEAALAVCVADGASPTQAHVTAANSAWTTVAGGLI
jgi:hypothetical protein